MKNLDSFEDLNKYCGFEFKSFFNLLSPEDLIDEINFATMNQRPYAFSRFNDGEGKIFSFQKSKNYFDLKTKLVHWFGPEFRIASKFKVSSTVQELEKKLANSFHGSDTIGLPIRDLTRESMIKFQQPILDDIRALFTWINEQPLKPRKVVESRQLNFPKYRENFLKMLDYPKNTVYLISPIPLIDYFDEVLKIKAIQKSPPPERPLEKKLHYPTIYNEIIEWIKKNAKNRLFLIGAGPLGKDYCYQVKNNGGIAVDLGSLFDKIAYDRNELKKYSRKFRREISDREGYLAYIPNFKKFHPL